MTINQGDHMDLLFTPLPIQLACPVLVTEDGRTIDDAGQPIPLEDRKFRCAVWAHWMVGGQVSCDIHTKIVCDITDIDFAGLVEEAGRDLADALTPWTERQRCSQEEADQVQATCEQAFA